MDYPEDDLFKDSYQDILNGTFQRSINYNKNYGSSSSIFRLSLVLLLRAGYILIQLGSVPTESIYVILLQNIVDIAVSTSSFGLVGFIFAFGYDAFGGIVGHGMWIVSGKAELDQAIFGFCACLMATAIITTLLSSRLHFVGYLCISFFFSALYQPIIMHWVWDDNGWMFRKVFLHHDVSVKDHAGSITVHLTAGVVGLVGALFLGRRLLKLVEIDDASIGTESPGSTITGYVFVALGTIAFSLPTPFYEQLHPPNNYIAIILVNNIMAMSAGIIVVVALHFLIYHQTFNYWIILRCMQGAIAGLVSVSAGVDVYSPIVAYFVAFFGAFIFYFMVLIIHYTALEDYCNIIAIHLVCGLLGALLPPLVGSSENLGSSVTLHFQMVHFGWQIICCLTVVLLTLLVFIFLFLLFSATGFLRNKNEEINHRRSKVAGMKGPARCCLERLYKVQSGTRYVEPGLQKTILGKNFRTDKAVAKKHAPESKIKQKQTNRRNRTNLEKINTEDEVSPRIKKSRFIYTVSNMLEEPEKDEKKLHERILGSGDTKIYTPSEFINVTKKKYTSKKLKADKKISFIELHRTKKCRNFVKNQHFIKKLRKQMQQKKVITEAEIYENIFYDSKFNDGFVTTKIPPHKMDSCSDLSENGIEYLFSV